MKNTISLIISFLVLSTVYSQDITFIDHGFSDENIEVPEEFTEKDEIILLQDRKVEIVGTDQGVEEYVLIHEKILVNSDEAIEKNNRIYISFQENERIVVNKNRVILPNSKIISLSDEDIHEETDTETGRSYAYYAIKGLEKGAIIEKLYLKQVSPDLTDKSFIFQFNAPVVRSTFELIHPSYLGFKTKSYNGLSEPNIDKEKYEEKVSITLEANNIGQMNYDEKSANPMKHIQYFRYKLHENFAKGTKNFYNYNEFAGNAFRNLNVELSKKDEKAINKFTKDLSMSDDMYSNVLAIENLIKTSIISDNYYRENSSVSDLLKVKKGRIIDLLILYKAIFKKYSIPAEFVFTTDRFEKYFDPEFETTNNLTYGIIYFPKLDMYLDPRNKSLRVPLINYGLANNDGIRLKEKTFGGEIMAVAKPIFIDITSMEVTTDTMRINIDFTEDIANPTIESQIIFGGYSGANLQSIVDIVPEDRYKEILDDIVKNYSADVEMDKMDVLNNGLENMGKKNFTLDLVFKGEELNQKAGDKYLFKLGEVIGKQSEIYQSEERMFPVEISYPHHYYRTLTIQLPEGYKISNPEISNLNFETIIEDKVEALFVSEYSLNDNTYKVVNSEYYNIVDFPVENFESYQAVLNAAADFNKIVIVLEKE